MAWYQKSHSMPRQLIFYRDGVSESQYGMVSADEVPQVRQGFREAEQEIRRTRNPQLAISTPALTFVVVGKRHHTRFYPGSFNGNTPSGGVVDRTVVSPRLDDFYLQSHSSPIGIGTARSSHYVVIEPGNLTLAQIQTIVSTECIISSSHELTPYKTNKLCYTASRCTKAVAVCTPARYADLICDRLRCYLRPALCSGYNVPTAIPGVPTVADYANDANIWRRGPNATRTDTPWHLNMDNTMFYI